ncbi:MAG: metallophosphoesterase family protein [Pseudomonadales bacterium]|nr:metallophosphoesterase family protein [Pseudomonadales bacterium]
MKIGIVSDIHGNLPGLNLALDIMGSVDRLLCPGDAFDEHSFSNDVVRRLRELDADYVLGNHEDVFFSNAGVRARNHKGVDQDLVAWAAERPHHLELKCDNKRLLLFHSTPWEPYGDYIFPHMTAKLERFCDFDADYMVYGHTHSQLLKRKNGTLVINPGSAGHGRDPSNSRHLSCCVLDTSSDEAIIHNYPDPRLA